MEKVTYTPAEFAAVFGRERTWAYRQLYAGKVQAITELGRTLIPKSEVDRLLKEAGRYLGSKAKPRKGDNDTANGAQKPATNSWAAALKKKRNLGSKDQISANSEKEKSGAADSRRQIYDRLTRRKNSGKQN